MQDSWFGHLKLATQHQHGLKLAPRSGQLALQIGSASANGVVYDMVSTRQHTLHSCPLLLGLKQGTKST